MENLERPKDSKEFREQQAERMITFLDRIHAYEYTQELLSKIHVGDNEGEKFSFEDFRNFLIRINGIARDIPIKKRKPDGYGVLLSGFVGEVLVPKHEDKENLLEYAYSKIGYLKNSGDEAYMLPAVINEQFAILLWSVTLNIKSTGVVVTLLSLLGAYNVTFGAVVSAAVKVMLKGQTSLLSE